MDPIGDVFREYLRDARSAMISKATKIAESYVRDGMDYGQVEEMLYYHGVQDSVIDEVLEDLFRGKGDD